MPGRNVRPIYEDNVAKSLGYVPVLSVSSAVAGGPSTLGILQSDGVGAMSVALTVLRALPNTMAGSATVSTPLSVTKSLAPTFDGTATLSTPLRVLKALIPT